MKTIQQKKTNIGAWFVGIVSVLLGGVLCFFLWKRNKEVQNMQEIEIDKTENDLDKNSLII